MKKEFKYWHREHGVRYFDKFLNPTPGQILDLPRSAIYHWVPEFGGASDIDTDHILLQGYNKKILVNIVSEYEKASGPVRKPVFQLKEALRPWLRKNVQKYKLAELNEIYQTNSPEVLSVINYGYLERIYKYLNLIDTPYYRWENLWRTVWANVARIASRTDKYQFIPIDVPRMLKGRTILEKFQDAPPSNTMIKIFTSSGINGLNELDMWRWLSVDYRTKSLMGQVDPKHYGKIILIFKGTAGQVAINLGYLNSWIKGQQNVTEFGSVIAYPAITLQKTFLKFSMQMMSVSADLEESGESVVLSTQPAEQTISTSEEPEQNSSQNDRPDQPEVEGEEEDFAREVKPMPLQKNSVRKTSPLDGAKDEVAMPKPPALVDDDVFADLDKDIQMLDRVSLKQLKDSGVSIAKDAVATSGLDKPGVTPEIDMRDIEKEIEQLREVIAKPVTPSQRLKKLLEDKAEASLLSVTEYRRYEKDLQAYQESDDPYETGQKRVEAMVIKPENVAIKPEEAQIKIDDATPDKTMGQSTFKVFNKKYINEVMKKDVLRMVDAIQTEGVIIRNHSVETKTTISGSYEHHTLEIKPIDGQLSTIHFTLPVVNEDGTFISSGSKYIMRSQIVDQVIRKIGPQEVSLSTYYGKLFVRTSPKVSNRESAWLVRKINMLAVDPESVIKTITPGNFFKIDFVAPFLFNALSTEFEEIALKNGTVLKFSQEGRKAVNPDLLKLIEKNGRRWCGFTKDLKPLVMDTKNELYVVSKDGETKLGRLAQLLGIDDSKAPIDFAEMSVYSKYVPLGIVLAYYVGFEKLLALLKVPYRTTGARQQKKMREDEYLITFMDKAYILKRHTKEADLIFSGFQEYDKILRNYEADLFNHKAVYLNILMAKGMGAIYIRQLDSLEASFIDPISKEVLEQMGEPQTFLGLLLRSCEMLSNYNHPRPMATNSMRIRGYERFAGTVYKELMLAIRTYKSQNLVGRSKINISPYQIWNAIMSDPAVKIVEDINPIQNLKESEIVTYSGTGGRNRETMTKPTRAYDPDNFGVISQDTVDSSNVGTVAYMSANPNLTNLRGTITQDKEINPTRVTSTATLISPCAANDNPKRMMFINTQHSHTIASSAYRQPYVRTGYDPVLARRNTALFCASADEDGVVESVDKKGMVVKYASGKTVGIELGRRYGRAEGTTYPHDIVTPYSPKEKFKAGDILAYNTKFYEPDFIDPKNIVLKVGRPILTAFLEAPATHEDSSAISERASQLFETEVIKERSYVVSFDEEIHNVKRVGSDLDPKDVLMVVTDGTISETDRYSEQSLRTLEELARSSSRVGVVGRLERIEVYYHGDKQMMSPSLRKLADRCDAELSSERRAVNKPVVTGKVGEEHRVGGNPLDVGKAEIRFYISTKGKTGVGDKGVFTHQMKTTIAEVITGGIYTDDGEQIDALFSYSSVANRGVMSAKLVGTTISLLDHIGRKAADLYFGDVK